MPSSISTVPAASKVANLKPGYYAGFWSFVWREVPFSAIQMPVYELLRSWSLGSRRKDHELSFLQNARNGAISGVAGKSCLRGAFFTNPIDVIKTQMMTSREAHSASMVKTGLQIWNVEGLEGFMKGVFLRMSHIAFGSILFFCSYEFVKARLRKRYSEY